MRFGEKLLAAGIIDEAQLEAGLAHQQQTGQRIGEALYELGYLGEEQLLAALAREFGTRYVSAQKLSRARVEPELLQLVPLKFAEENLVVPILRGKDGRSLGAVTCEPQNQQIAEELSILTGFSSVRFFVATRQALQALIRKLYRGDLRAFDSLAQAGASPPADDLSADGGDIQQEPPGMHSGRVVAEVENGDTETRQKTSSWTRAVESVRESSLLSDNDFIETLAILVGLLEMQSEHRQGHSARVARLTKAVSAAFDLDERQSNHHLIGAYLHDLGKRTSSHLTLLSIAANSEHRYLAKRYHLTPARLFDAVHLPREVNRILAHLYETFDGSGLPEELSGDRIPLGSRIIAAVDAFDDLVHNPNNLVGATLEPQQALARMRKEAGVLFDEQVIKALEVALQQQATLAAGGRVLTVLVADPDASASADLELKLSASGFEVTTARDSETVINLLGSNPPDAMVVDYSMAPDDGLALLDRARAVSKTMPVFMTASDPQPQVVTDAFKHDVTDFVTRPFLPEVLVAKLQKEMSSSRPPPVDPLPAAATPGHQIVVEVDADEATVDHSGDLPTPSSVTISGVGGSHGAVLSGSLEGKSALSLFRALAAKRRTGHLSLRLGKQKGELHFNQGHIFQAMVGENQGEEAFLELATWRDCLYRFDPSQQPTKRVINTATAKLLQIAKLMS